MAAVLCPDAPVVHLGAALPDLASGAGVRLGPASGPLALGIKLHHQTDGVFHSDKWFVDQSAALTRLARTAGFNRGAARAIGHVGVEFLLDDALDAEGNREFVSAAFGQIDVHRTELAGLCDDPRWSDLLGRVNPDARPPRDHGTRIWHLTSRRPRLAFEPELIPAVDELIAEFGSELGPPSEVVDRVAQGLGT